MNDSFDHNSFEVMLQGTFCEEGKSVKSHPSDDYHIISLFYMHKFYYKEIQSFKAKFLTSHL